jgi:hypothetical protein
MKFDDQVERNSPHFTVDQLEYVTKICRKLSESYLLNLIREKYYALHSMNPKERIRSEGFLGANQQHGNKFVAGSDISKQLDDNIIVLRMGPKKEDVEKVSQLEALLRQFDEENSNHKIDIAYSIYENVLELVKNKNEMDENPRKQVDQLLEKYDTIFKELVRLYKELLFVHGELSAEDGWTVEKVRKGMTVKYKAEKGESVGLKFEMEIDIPFIHLLALVYEVDLYPQWYPFMKSGSELKVINKATKIVHLELSFPPPISNREGYFFGCGYDRLQKNGTIFMAVNSIHNDPKIAKIYEVEIPGTSKHVRMDVKYFAFEVILQSREKALIKAVANADPKLKFVPMSFINWTIRKFSYLLMERLIHKAKNFKGSPWEKRIRENPAFYNWASGVVEGYFTKQEQNNSPNMNVV